MYLSPCTLFNNIQLSNQTNNLRHGCVKGLKIKGYPLQDRFGVI